MIIVDASVAVKWIQKEEELQNKAIFLLQNHKNKLDEILIPRFLFLEVANALATKSKTKPKHIKLGLKILTEAELIIHSESEEELVQATLLARKYKTTVYDMLYAVIAKNKKLKLITADEKFLAKTKFKFVKLLKDI